MIVIINDAAINYLPRKYNICFITDVRISRQKQFRIKPPRHHVSACIGAMGRWAAVGRPLL
jgi:hypothetical protein